MKFATGIILILVGLFKSVWFKINASNNFLWRKLRKKHGTVEVGDQTQIVEDPRLPRIIGYCPLCARSIRSATELCSVSGKKIFEGGDFVAKRGRIIDDPKVKIGLEQTILITDNIDGEEVTFQGVCINPGCYVLDPKDSFWLFDDDGKIIAETPSLERHAVEFSKSTRNS